MGARTDQMAMRGSVRDAERLVRKLTEARDIAYKALGAGSVHQKICDAMKIAQAEHNDLLAKLARM